MANFVKANLVVGAILGALATTASAYPIKCNHEQTECYTEGKRLTVGDEVGVVNEDGQLVATGTIESIRDGVRKINITKRSGKITREDSVDLYDSATMTFKAYRQTPKIAVGGDLGMLAIGLGEASSGFIGEGYGQWHYKRGIYFGARGLFLSASGRATSLNAEVPNTQDFTLTGFGIMPTVALGLMEQRDVSLRLEGGLGLSSLSGSVGGGSGEAADYLEGYSSGMGLLLRGSVAVMMHYDSWHPMIGGEILHLSGIRGAALTAGFLKDIN